MQGPFFNLHNTIIMALVALTVLAAQHVRPKVLHFLHFGDGSSSHITFRQQQHDGNTFNMQIAMTVMGRR